MLADRNLEAVGWVAFDGHEVVGNDGEGMAVNGELEDAVDGDVDELEEVLCLRLEDYFKLLAAAGAFRVGRPRAVKIVGAVDQTALESRSVAEFGGVPAVEGLNVGLILKEKSAEVFVIVTVRRAVDDHAAE